MSGITNDPYDQFAEVYDEWQSLYPQTFSRALAPRIREVLKEWGVPKKRYADLACGTGAFADWWARRYPGWEIVGVDQSDAMIRIARDRLAKRILRGKATPPHFLVQPLTRLELAEPVGLATCLFDSLNHVTQRRDLQRIFRRVRAALLPNGVFIFDLVDEANFGEIFSAPAIVSGPDLYIGVESDFYVRKEAGLGRAVFTFFKKTGSGWKRLSAVINERCWGREEVLGFLEHAGLELLSFERISPRENENVFVPRTFWVCRRAG